MLTGERNVCNISYKKSIKKDVLSSPNMGICMPKKETENTGCLGARCESILYGKYLSFISHCLYSVTICFLLLETLVPVMGSPIRQSSGLGGTVIGVENPLDGKETSHVPSHLSKRVEWYSDATFNDLWDCFYEVGYQMMDQSEGISDNCEAQRETSTAAIDRCFAKAHLNLEWNKQEAYDYVNSYFGGVRTHCYPVPHDELVQTKPTSRSGNYILELRQDSGSEVSLCDGVVRWFWESFSDSFRGRGRRGAMIEIGLRLTALSMQGTCEMVYGNQRPSWYNPSAASVASARDTLL